MLEFQVCSPLYWGGQGGVTGLGAGTGRRIPGVEMVASPNTAELCTACGLIRAFAAAAAARDIGPYLLTIAGSNGINSSSINIESDL